MKLRSSMTDMLVGALSAVCDGTRLEGEREQWARVAACLFAELPESETTTGAMLSAATKCLDAPPVVRTLVSAVWCVHGDESNVSGWIAKLAERARAGRHVRTVVTLVDLLTCTASFDGVMTEEVEASSQP